MMWLSRGLSIYFVAGVASLPHSNIKRDATQLRDSYDFVIAGGGTVGLTVADRLSEAFPDKTILVVEYGENKYAPGIFDPPETAFGLVKAPAGAPPAPPAPPRPNAFAVPALPCADVSNKPSSVTVGKAVGGSSAINGMFFDRPSRFDCDAWAAAGSPEFDSAKQKWDWEGVYPSFKKSVTFTPPTKEAVDKWGYTWDQSVFDNTTPIHSSFPPFQWGDHLVVRDAWEQMNMTIRQECGGGDKDGLCWVPYSQHPITARRSHAGIGHYDDIKASRSNYDLLVLHQVVRVFYPNGPGTGPPVVEARSLGDNRLFNISAKADVIISAGAMHTPTILQRSGIGPKAFLTQRGINTVIDLPGVGSNYQDHWGPGLTWSYNNLKSFNDNHYPLPEQMYNASFFADAVAGFDEIPARGPYTLAMSSTAVYMSLPNMTSEYTKIIDRIRSIAATPASAAAYLPNDIAADDTMAAGYQHQLLTLANFLANPSAPSLETAFASGTGVRLVLLHPLSRGTVRISANDPLDVPTLDTRLGSNPVDFDLHIAHVRWLRQMIDTPSMREAGAYYIAPTDNVKSEDYEAMKEFVKQEAVLSFLHPCCTAAMLPREKGGVVGPDLRVHGAKGLRVADMSAIPFLPSAHLSATAYGFAEKAASIIIEEYEK